jgi:hypothetical protein
MVVIPASFYVLHPDPQSPSADWTIRDMKPGADGAALRRQLDRLEGVIAAMVGAVGLGA